MDLLSSEMLIFSLYFIVAGSTASFLNKVHMAHYAQSLETPFFVLSR